MEHHAEHTVAAELGILLVEDDIDVREGLIALLATCDRHVIGVRNGVEALDWLRHNPAPRLILLDLMMPVMNGYEFRAEQLRDESLSPIPVVLLSAHGELPRDAKAMKVSGYVAKPIDMTRLLELVDRHCA